MLMENVKIHAPDTIAAHAMQEFEMFVERVYTNDQLDHASIEIDEVLWDAEKGCAVLCYSGVPDGPDGDVTYDLVISLIARMVSVRSRRRDAETGELRLPPIKWTSAVRKHFAPMYDRSGGLDVGSGWFDLIVAMSDRLSVPNLERPSFDQIKTKYGTLRAYHSSDVQLVEDIVMAAENISGSVCENCGAPGKTMGKGWIVTACSLHEPDRAK